MKRKRTISTILFALALTLIPSNAEQGELLEFKPIFPQDPNAVQTLKVDNGEEAKAELSSQTKNTKEPIQEKVTEKKVEKTKEQELVKLEIKTEKKLADKQRFVDIKNEYYQSLKVELKHNNKTQELYFNAYELLKEVIVSKDSNLTMKVFDVYGNYIGYIDEKDKNSKELRISPFSIIKASIPEEKELELPKKETSFEEIKEISSAKIKEEKIEEPAKKEEVILVEKPEPLKEYSYKAKSLKAPQPFIPEELKIKKPIIDSNGIEMDDDMSDEMLEMVSIDDKTARYIKVANIGEENIHIDIYLPDGSAIGKGWTVSNDIYVPQYLNFQAQPVDIDPESELQIFNTTSQKLITKKKAKELNVDQKGNYVWFINQINEI